MQLRAVFPFYKSIINETLVALSEDKSTVTLTNHGHLETLSVTHYTANVWHLYFVTLGL